MSRRTDDEGLRLVLEDVHPSGDPDLELAVAQAAADLERIRLGLRLVAEELPRPSAPARPLRRPAWRLAAFAAAAVAALALVVVALTGRHAGHVYEPGGMRAANGGPRPPYSVATLSAVSASSRNTAWIIGSVAWRWNGRTWRRVSLPKVGSFVLASVATVGARSAWAVGWRGSGHLVESRPLIEHWDGARWTVAQVPLHDPASLFAVSAAGPRNVWAVGATFRSNRFGKLLPHATRPLLLHWDGGAWHKVALPWARPGLELDKVVATGPSSVWAAASGLQRPGPQIAGSIEVEHWDGRRWQAVPAPFGPKDFISGFGASSGSDAWAVGSYSQGRPPAGHSHALAAHWNGHAWRILPVPNRSGSTDSSLSDVVALRPDDAWALGQSQHVEISKDESGTTISSRGPVALFEHWNGERWQIAPAPEPPQDYGRQAGYGGLFTTAADGTAWAVGSCYSDNVVARWDGLAWTVTPHPQDQRRRPNMPRPARDRTGGCTR